MNEGGSGTVDNSKYLQVGGGSSWRLYRVGDKFKDKSEQVLFQIGLILLIRQFLPFYKGRIQFGILLGLV